LENRKGFEITLSMMEVIFNVNNASPFVVNGFQWVNFRLGSVRFIIGITEISEDPHKNLCRKNVLPWNLSEVT